MPGSPPRPVGRAPQAPLTGDTQTLARDWLLELLAVRPLAEAGAVPLAALAEDGPAACGQVLAGLGSDAALAGLGPAARLLVVIGAGAPDGVAAACEALRRVLWRRLTAELADASAVECSAVADRLGHVLGMLLGLALAGSPASADGWAQTIGDAVGARQSCAVVLVEVTDRPRLEHDGEVAGLLDDGEAALCERLRPGDRLVRELPGRWWVVTAAAGARRHAATLAQPLAEHRGVALTCRAGLASTGDVGNDPTELIDRAEQSLLAAQAAGAVLAP